MKQIEENAEMNLNTSGILVNYKGTISIGGKNKLLNKWC